MAKLPEQFLDRMKEQLGDEYGAFLASYEKESYAGLRVNTGKLTVEKFQTLAPFALRPIPWTGKGFYIGKTEQATKHPYYYAGLCLYAGAECDASGIQTCRYSRGTGYRMLLLQLPGERLGAGLPSGRAWASCGK